MSSATLILSDASEWMTPYHDRMSVLLTPDDFDGWPRARARGVAAGGRGRVVSSPIIRTDYGEDDPTIVKPVAEAS